MQPGAPCTASTAISAHLSEKSQPSQCPSQLPATMLPSLTWSWEAWIRYRYVCPGWMLKVQDRYTFANCIQGLQFGHPQADVAGTAHQCCSNLNEKADFQALPVGWQM